jgi:hypothetical protein
MGEQQDEPERGQCRECPEFNHLMGVELGAWWARLSATVG